MRGLHLARGRVEIAASASGRCRACNAPPRAAGRARWRARVPRGRRPDRPSVSARRRDRSALPRSSGPSGERRGTRAAAWSNSAFCRCANPIFSRAIWLPGSAARIFRNCATPSSACPVLTSITPRLLRASRFAGSSVTARRYASTDPAASPVCCRARPKLIPRLGVFRIERRWPPSARAALRR